MRLKAYENASIYKERIKRWYDKRLKKKEFKEGDKVLAKQVGQTLCCSFGALQRSGNHYGCER
jgi:hypothetical protein